MSQKTKTPAGKGKKKKDIGSRKRMVGAVIAIIIVFTMLVALFEAVFQGNSINPAPQTSLRDKAPTESTYVI